MKKYEVKKDLPGIEKGTIVGLSDDNKGWLHCVPGSSNREIGHKKAVILDEAKKHKWLEEIEEKKKDTAYNGMYISTEDSMGYFFRERFSFLNADDSVNYSKKIYAMKAVWKRHAENDGDFVPDWEEREQKKYRISYNNISKDWWTDSIYAFMSGFFLPYFSTAGKAQQCIEDLGDVLDDLLL